MRRLTPVVLVTLVASSLNAAAMEPWMAPPPDPFEQPKPEVVEVPVPPKPPFNWEPFVLTGLGTAMVGVGIWRLFAAEADYLALRALASMPTPGLDAEQVLLQARTLVQSGKLNTGLGWGLLGFGVAAIGGSIAWLVVDGMEKSPVVAITPLPGGAAAVVEGRF